MFESKQLDKIKKIYDGLTPTEEFEFMFNNYANNPLTISKFLHVLDYMRVKSKSKIKMEEYDSLDVNYNYDKNNLNSYRVSIDGVDKINKMMAMVHKRLNHVIFSILISNDEDLTIINKVKYPDRTFNIDDYDIRVRTSDEKKLTKEEMKKLTTINENERFNITFRYKHRASLFIVDNKNITIRLDATIVRMSTNINTIMESSENYELELEVIKHTKLTAKENDKYFTDILDEVLNIKKTLQQSDYIMTNTEKNQLLEQYKKLVYEDKPMSFKGLYLMQPISLEIQHVTDYLPNKYSVTDKADGDRYFMFIMKDKVFLVSTLLDFKYIGIELKGDKKKYNNTIIDGEYIFLPQEKKYLYLAFDILFYQGNDMRNTVLLKDRLTKLDDVINTCLDSKYEFKEYNGDFNLKKILDHHNNEIHKFMNDVNDTIKNNKLLSIIKRKYFIFALGAEDNEIFSYSKLMWDVYVNDETTKCPYLLDGLLYTALEQKYTKNLKEIKYNTYKWKPPNKNSIDFYIQYERNPENNQILTLFDDSNDEKVSGKYYKICNLYVGRLVDDNEQPVLFRKDEGIYVAYLFVDSHGEARDMEGNLIMDNTVVEFYYDDSVELDDKYRWVPIRTRFDKTESVRKYRRKYGNNEEVANRVWSSIRNRFTIDDINKLADKNIYETQMKLLKTKIDRSVITAERRQNVYYQIITNLAKPQRQFHNWIKSNLIYTWCSRKNIDKKDQKALTILDVGVGRGGDIMKFYHSRVNMLVGIDQDNYGINFATDGAISRYNQFRSKFPGFPKMYFMQGDAGVLLNVNDQTKALGVMADKNNTLLAEYFGQTENDKTKYKYDVFNCQFMIHYLFKNDTIWNNFIKNVNKYMADDGFMLVTTFDADRIIDHLKDSNNYSVYYVNKNGEKKIFFDIVKKYDVDPKNKNWMNTTGLPIDFHSALISEEGVYITEYLVAKDFLISEMKNKCGLEIVETDLFENVFYNHKDFLFNAAESESNVDTRGFFMSVKRFYDMNDDENKASFELTKLNRYYIFRKVEKQNKKKI